MRERGLVAAGSRDRHGQTVRRHRTGERDLAGDWRTNRPRVPDGNVDATVLSTRIGVLSHGVPAQHGPVDRPGPGPGTLSAEQSPRSDGERGDEQLRCPEREHEGDGSEDPPS